MDSYGEDDLEKALAFQKENESNPFLKLPSVAHEIMTEHMNAKTVNSLRGTSNILKASLKDFQAMKKALDRTCLDAIKNPSTKEAIRESNAMCVWQRFTTNELTLKCRNETDVCDRVFLNGDRRAYESENGPITNMFKIPYGFVMIGPGAFADTSVKHVRIPDTVTNIGELAFSRCEKLVEVEMPDSVEIVNSSAFKGCRQLKKLIMSSNIRHLGVGAFLACTNLELVFRNLPQRLAHGSLAKAFFPPYLFMGDIGGPKQITFQVDLKNGPFQFPFNTLLKDMPNIQNIEIVIEALE